MKLAYGWVIVAVGIVVGCISIGGVMSFGVSLQPMAESRLVPGGDFHGLNVPSGRRIDGICAAAGISLAQRDVQMIHRARLAP